MASKALKRELRKQMKQILLALSTVEVSEQTSIAVKTLLLMPEYQNARRISVYLSMPAGEISTSTIVRDALSKGKKVFVPCTYKTDSSKETQPKSIMDMLELESPSDYDSFEPDGWGIPTPNKDSVPSRANSFGSHGLTEGKTEPSAQAAGGLDLIVMPGMAFDSQFGRLGHGKGYYDYFLQRCHQFCQQGTSKFPFCVGLSLKEQLLPPSQSVPMDPSDHRLDALIVGDGQLLRSEQST